MTKVWFKSFSKEKLERVAHYLKLENITFIRNFNESGLRNYIFADMDRAKARKIAELADVGLEP